MGEHTLQTEPPETTRGRRGQTEILTIPQRFGELVSVAIILLILAFYVYHQMANTGFFTTKFGPLEMFAFYGSIVLSLVPAGLRAFMGRRNPVRPIEATCNAFFAFASLWLFYVFPFNFTHFPDALPEAIRFMFWWLTNDIARIALLLAFVGGLFSAGYNVVRYVVSKPN
jgi:hypothetical protein